MLTTRRTIRSGALLAGIALAAQPAAAELPAPIRAMVDAALATGDEAKVATVIELASQTNPDDADELNSILKDFRKQKRELAAAEARRKREAILNAGLFDRWSGKGQVGAFQSSGNSDNVGVSVAVALERKGIDWEHRLKATADYQRSNGLTSREQYLASYEPRFQINKRLFSYALAQYERDRFQGFLGRYSLSGGLGYKVLDGPSAQLSIKAGPSWRSVDYTDGSGDSSLGGLAGLDFDWKLARNLTLTQDTNLVADSGSSASVIVDSTSTSVLLVTGLEAKISDRLSTRLAYTVDYDSNPPAGKVTTDTMTRFTLVYGF